MRQVQSGEFDLLRPIRSQRLHAPVIQGPVIFELQRADGMGDPLNRIRQGVRIIVHRVNAPGIAGAMVSRSQDPVQDRVAHGDVGRRHIDLGPQRSGSIRELPGFHPPEQVKILLHRPVAIRAVASRFRQRSPVFPHFLGAQIADVGLSQPDQLFSVFIKLGEIIRRIKHAVAPVEAKPLDVFLNGVDVFDVFLAGVRIIEA